jgi:hypothetical protein
VHVEYPMFGAAAAAINGSLCPLNTRLCPHLQILCDSPAKQVVILCHSAGGASTCELLRQRMKAEGASECEAFLMKTVGG